MICNHETMVNPLVLLCLYLGLPSFLPCHTLLAAAASGATPAASGAQYMWTAPTSHAIWCAGWVTQRELGRLRPAVLCAAACRLQHLLQPTSLPPCLPRWQCGQHGHSTMTCPYRAVPGHGCTAAKGANAETGVACVAAAAAVSRAAALPTCPICTPLL